MKPQLKMLNDMYELILNQENVSKEDAFHKLLEFFASHFEFEEETVPSPWLKTEVYEQLCELLDLNLLQEDQWDWFGELHKHHQLNLIQGDYDISYAHCEKIAEYVLKSKPNKKQLQRVLDPVSGTGRNVLVLAKKEPNAFYYLADEDLISYRIAMLNMQIYGIHAVVLKANANKHDLREFSPNWRYANRWHTVKETKLFSKEEVDERMRRKEGLYHFV